MPATAWTVQNATNTGVVPTFQAIDQANGNKFKNNGRVRLRIKGAAAATGTVTFLSFQRCNRGFQHDTGSVANGLDAAAKELEFGPFEPGRWNDASGDMNVGWIGTVTGITVSVIDSYYGVLEP